MDLNSLPFGYHGADVVDSCLTEEEKQILSFKCGETVITAKDQFVMRYGNFKIPYPTKEDFCKRFAFIVEENRNIIRQIKDLVEKRERLLDLDAYKLKSEGLTTNDEYKRGTSTHLQKSYSKNDNYHLSLVESDTDVKELTKTQTGESHTNKLRDVEPLWDSKNLIQREKIKNRKSISKDGDTYDVATPENKEEVVEAAVENKSLDSFISYQDFTLTNVGDHSVNYTNSQSENLSKTVTDTKATHDTNSDQSIKGEMNLNRAVWLEKDALLEAGEIEMPKLRDRFGKKFNKLFEYGYLY